MDINFKDILQKLSVFKNNTALLVPIIIAVVGLLLLIPAHLFSRSVTAQVQKASVTDLGSKVDRYTRDQSPPVQEASLDARIAAQQNQAIGMGHIKDLAEGRRIICNSFDVETFCPKQTDQWDQNYARFKDLKNA